MEPPYSAPPLIDPSVNVKALSEADQKRQDDLRAASEKFVLAEAAHVREIGELRAEHQRELDRFDREEVAKTTAAQQTATQMLATNTSAMAETLRIQMADTAATIATQQTATNNDFNKRLSLLELGASERQGKQTVQDPAMALFVQRIESLLESRSLASGERRGVNWVVVAVVGAVGFVATMLGIFGTLLGIAAALWGMFGK